MGRFLLLGGVLSYPQPTLEAIRSPNELIRIYEVRALVDDLSLRLDEAFARYGPVVDFSRHEGHVYSDKAPGLTFIAVPVYGFWRLWQPSETISNAALMRVLRFFCLLLPTLIWLWFFENWLCALGLQPAFAALFAAASVLCTPAFAYLGQFVGHQAAAWALGLAFYFAGARKKTPSLQPGDAGTKDGPCLIRSTPSFLGAGFFFAFAVCTEYPVAALTPFFLALALAGSKKKLLALFWLSIGAIPPLFLTGLHNHLAFGAFYRTGYAFIGNPAFLQNHAQGFFGIGWPSREALWALSFGFKRGLFSLSLWLFLGLAVALIKWARDFKMRPPALHGALIGASLTAFFVAAGYGYWLGGWSVGPRHLVAVLPFIALLATFGLHHLVEASSSLTRALVAGFLLHAALVNGAIALTYPGFPEEFNAPFYELTLPLLLRLQSGYNLLNLRGLDLRLSFVTGAAALCALVFFYLRPLFDNIRSFFATLVFTTVLFVAQNALRPPFSPEAIYRADWLINRMWEPR